jgi:hypothetical protein
MTRERMRHLTPSRAHQHAALFALLTGCSTLPPVLTPVRIADRGIAPLARTAEVRLSPTVYYEQERHPDENSAAQMTFDVHDIALRPNFFAAFAFTDSFAWVLPGAVLWSPVVEREYGFWLTLGGGVYGFGFGSNVVRVTDVVGVWAKRRFGSAFWLSGGLATFHNYESDDRWPACADRACRNERPERPPEHWVRLIPGIEGGVQLAEAWAITVLADYDHSVIGGVISHARLRTDLVLVPTWWLDLAVHGGINIHEREPTHVDPLVGFTVTARW